MQTDLGIRAGRAVLEYVGLYAPAAAVGGHGAGIGYGGAAGDGRADNGSRRVEDDLHALVVAGGAEAALRRDAKATTKHVERIGRQRVNGQDVVRAGGARADAGGAKLAVDVALGGHQAKRRSKGDGFACRVGAAVCVVGARKHPLGSARGVVSAFPPAQIAGGRIEPDAADLDALRRVVGAGWINGSRQGGDADRRRGSRPGNRELHVQLPIANAGVKDVECCHVRVPVWALKSPPKRACLASCWLSSRCRWRWQMAAC